MPPLQDANYYSLDRSRRGAAVSKQSLDLGLEKALDSRLETALDNLDAAMLSLPMSRPALVEMEEDDQHHGHSHSHRGRSRTFMRNNRLGP